ncbi:hypothetical protein ACVGV7_00455, partial [Enterobacter intestinihominis]
LSSVRQQRLFSRLPLPLTSSHQQRLSSRLLLPTSTARQQRLFSQLLPLLSPEQLPAPCVLYTSPSPRDPVPNRVSRVVCVKTGGGGGGGGAGGGAGGGGG